MTTKIKNKTKNNNFLVHIYNDVCDRHIRVFKLNIFNIKVI